MTLRIENAELFGVTESSLTLYFSVEADDGPIDAPANVRIDGEIRCVCEGISGTRRIEIDCLDPDTEYRIEIETSDGSPAIHDDPFPATARTLPKPSGELVASFATLNDLHFGEPRFGVEMTWPFYQTLDGPQLERDWQLTAGWQWAF